MRLGTGSDDVAAAAAVVERVGDLLVGVEVDTRRLG